MTPSFKDQAAEKQSLKKQCPKVQELLSGYLDQELTQQQSQLVRVHLESCDDCQAVYNDLKTMRDSIGNLQYPDCEERKIEHILNEPVAKSISVIGWVFLIIGVTALMIYHAFTFYTADEVSLAAKVFIFLIEAGSLALFIAVLRQRLIARKTDKYRNVQL